MRSGSRSPCSWFAAIFVSVVLLASGVLAPEAFADEVSDQEQRVQQIADQLEALENRIGQLEEDHAATLDRIDGLNVEIAEAQAGIDAQNVELAELQAQMSAIAVDRFTSGGGDGLTPIFSTATQYTEALQRQEYSRVALNQGTGTSDELRDLLSTLAEDQADLQAKQDEQVALLASLEQQQADGEALTQQFHQQYAAAQAELGDLVQQEQERRYLAAVAQAQAAEEAAQQKAAAAAAAAAATPRGGGSAANRASSNGGSSSNGGGSSSGGSSNGGGSSSGGASSSDGGSSPSNGGSSSDSVGGAPSGGASGGGSSESGGSSAPPPASTAGIAVNSASSQLGVPYRFAAESPGVAFDCSGLTKWAWGRAGVYLPHQSGAQYASTPHVPKDAAQPGDLIFYRSPIGHVAIYIGGGQMIHAPATGDVVKVSPVRWERVVGVSRPG